MIESAVCWLLGESPCRSGASVHCRVVTCETQVWQLLGRRVTAQLIMSTSLVVEPPIISTLSKPIKNNFAVVSVSGTEESTQRSERPRQQLVARPISILIWFQEVRLLAYQLKKCQNSQSLAVLKNLSSNGLKLEPFYFVGL